MLRILHPLVAFRDCGHCRKYQYSEETGQPLRRKTTGELIERGAGSVLPCDKQRCVKGHWTKQKSLSQKNQVAYNYHLRCKITGQWPDDEVVIDNATIITRAEQQAENLQRWHHQKEIEKALWLIAGYE